MSTLSIGKDVSARLPVMSAELHILNICDRIN